MYYTQQWITLLNPVAKDGDITVNVTDGTDAISGATVVLSDDDELSSSKTTGDDGSVTYTDIDNGTYTITVSKSGYTTETEIVTVAGEDIEVDIELTPTRTISFTVQDSQDTPEAIQGATITIDGDTAGKKTTGSSGGCTATLADGEHTIVVEAEGYTTKTDTITTDSTHASFTISLVAT